MPRKKKNNVQEVADLAEPVAVEESRVDMIRTSLEEIKAHDGVIGFILRNSKSATIDLKDPTKIIDYAILSSSAFETSEVLSEDFKLGTVRSIVIQGEDKKVLSLTDDGNRISVFIEKDVEWEKILKKLSSL